MSRASMRTPPGRPSCAATAAGTAASSARSKPPASIASRAARRGGPSARMSISTRPPRKPAPPAIGPACAASPTRSAATARRWRRPSNLSSSRKSRRALPSSPQAVGYAPHHFQRLFKRDLGVSPAEYARGLRTQRAEAALKQNGRVTDAVYDAGYASPSGFYSDAKERLGMTPSAWRDGGRGETIRWTTFDSPIGPMLIAATSKGICRLTFDDSEASLRRLFPQGDDRPGRRRASRPRRRRARRRSRARSAARDLPIDVAGTAFQEAVWRELRKIPARRDPQLCPDRRRDRPAQGGPRGRHGQWRQPCRGAHPVPPRDPQRRHARRLCRRARPQAQAARRRGPSVGKPGAAAGRISRLPLASRSAQQRAERGRAKWHRAKWLAAGDKPLWRKIVDFPLVAMVIAVGALDPRRHRCRNRLVKFLIPTAPGFSCPDDILRGRGADPGSALQVFVIRQLGEPKRDDLPRSEWARHLLLAVDWRDGYFLHSRRHCGALGVYRIVGMRQLERPACRAHRIDHSRRGYGGAVVPRDPVPLARGVRRQLARACC